MKDSIKLSKKYYLDTDDSINVIYNACSCFEQFVYVVLRSYNINPCFVFCDDIIPKYIQNVKQHNVGRNFLNINKEVYTKLEVNVINNDYFHTIKKLVNNNYLVSFSTKFNMLPPYGWYKDENDHSYHTAIIVDYDAENYYFLDAPDLLEPSRTLKHFRNKEINIIHHKILHEAFDYICKLSILEINLDRFNSIKSTSVIVENIVFNYFNSLTEYHYGEIIFYGKGALNKMYHSINSPDFIYLRQTIFNHYFDLHLILSRHIILKECLKEENAILEGSKNRVIISELDKCIELWGNLKNIVFKNNVKEIKDYRKRIKYIFEKIMIQEEKFMNIII